MQVMTVTIARPPVRWPTRESKNSPSRLDRPPPSIRAPDRMKKGMAIRGKESTPVMAFWVMSARGILVKKTRVTRVEMPMA